MRVGTLRISKRNFYALGGFSNPRLFRKADKRGAWNYYYDNRRA